MLTNQSNQSHNTQIIRKQAQKARHRTKWSFQQTLKYCQFIGLNKNVLQETDKRQKQGVYNRMAEHVGTRSTHQCRSHHQKIIKRHKSIDQFIEYFLNKFQCAKKSFKSQKKEISQSLPGQNFEEENRRSINNKKQLIKFHEIGSQLNCFLIQQKNQIFQDQKIFTKNKPIFSTKFFQIQSQSNHQPEIQCILDKQICQETKQKTIHYAKPVKNIILHHQNILNIQKIHLQAAQFNYNLFQNNTYQDDQNQNPIQNYMSPSKQRLILPLIPIPLYQKVSQMPEDLVYYSSQIGSCISKKATLNPLLESNHIQSMPNSNC